MGARPTAAVITVGTELVRGLRVDTNSAEIAVALTTAGYDVLETISVADDAGPLEAAIARLAASRELVVVTGGLGPTDDDLTREAASAALGLPLARDEALAGALEPYLASHTDPDATRHVMRQAMLLRGARALDPHVGTAAGQVVATTGGRLVLLPGPPAEMRPMLRELLGEAVALAPPVTLGVAGMSESHAWRLAERALGEEAGTQLGVLAAPGDVQLVLYDSGAGAGALRAAADRVAEGLGEACYSTDGATLAEVVLRIAREQHVTIATAESCTGGMVGARLTDVPGASDTYLGGVVAYSNDSKVSLLDVPPGLLAQYGAVSEEAARAMAEGAVARLGATVAVAVTGIAGPGGGTSEKPVGSVWFALAGPAGTRAEERQLSADRARVRLRATAAALDLLRLYLTGM